MLGSAHSLDVVFHKSVETSPLAPWVGPGRFAQHTRKWIAYRGRRVFSSSLNLQLYVINP